MKDALSGAKTSDLPMDTYFLFWLSLLLSTSHQSRICQVTTKFRLGLRQI